MNMNININMNMNMNININIHKHTHTHTHSMVCYNERMLQQTDSTTNTFVNKIKLLQRTQMPQRTGILSADVARASA